MDVTRTCPFTGTVNTRHIEGLTQEAIDLWKGGALIQDAMPDLSPEDREFVMTGITPEVWNSLFLP